MHPTRTSQPRIAAALLFAAVAACTSSSAGLFPYLRPGAGGEHGTTFAAVDRGLVQAIATSQRPRAEAPPTPPIALTTSDGAGLVLARIEVDAVVTGPVALTQLHLTFHNPEARVREGRFAITLPTDAAVSRFAMKNEEWREAEVVTRMRARQVYESFLKQRVDPALLEKGAGNRFTARVFPIPPSADKELILTYSQEVSAATPYQVPLAGLPAVGELRWSVTVDGETRTGATRDRAPDDLRADGGAGAGARVEQALTAGDGFVARLMPPVTASADPLGAAIVLVDTSGSTAAILRRQAEAARAVVTAIAVRDPAAAVDVRAFDQAVEPVVAGPAGSIDVERMVEAIVARGGLGASDLGLALASARGDGRRLIVVSDGVATVGERTAHGLAERARAIGAARIDAVTVGGGQDRDLLTALTEAGGRGGAIIDGDDPAGYAALEQAMLGDVAVAVAGATDVWPTSLRGLAAGQPVVIYGHRKGDPRAPLAIRFAAAGQARIATLTPTPGPAPLIGRAVGRADVARLTAALAAAATSARRAELRRAIEQLGLAHRLVTSETSLLVLETDDDYARFCIDRRGLTGLLTVAHGAIEVIDRGAAAPTVDCAAEQAQAAAPTPPPPPPAPPAISATTGAVQGVIRDRRTHEPLIGATIVVTSGDRSETAITDERGWYIVTGLPPGPATLAIYYADTAFERRITIVANQVIDTGGGAAAAPPATATTATNGADPADARPPAIGGVADHAPIVDDDPPRTGMTIEPEYVRNVPVGRTFGATLGTAAGSQDDRVGVSFSGSSTVENTYVVDGINLDVQQRGGEMITITDRAPMIDTASTSQGITITREYGHGMVDLGSTMIGLTAASDREEIPEPPPPPPPYEGRMLTVMQRLRDGQRDAALREALAWYLAEPTDLAAIVALGEALEARGAVGLAARAYGTILDRFPDRVELVRYAGERLDRLGPAGRARALDAYQQAVADRPDQATGYRLLAIAQVRAGDLEGALTTLERGLGRAPSDGIRTILRGDLGLVGAALAARAPDRRAELAARLQRRGVTIAAGPSLRFVLHWETDTNDVDLHVRDRHGAHAYYQDKKLRSGGELLEDITTGYGPEAFVIPGAATGGPYRLSTLYFARGAMGLGLGTVQVVAHDGAGGLTIEDRPFLLQIDHAEVDLGSY